MIALDSQLLALALIVEFRVRKGSQQTVSSCEELESLFELKSCRSPFILSTLLSQYSQLANSLNICSKCNTTLVHTVNNVILLYKITSRFERNKEKIFEDYRDCFNAGST